MRWSDDRLDDLARTVEKNSGRQDATQNLVAALDLKVTEMERERRLGQDHRFSIRLMLGGLLIGQAGEILMFLINRR